MAAQHIHGLKEIENVFFDVQLMRYITGAGFIMLCYDHLLTLDREVEFIWKARWSLVKVFFIGLRYTVPSAMLLQILLLSDLPHFHLSDTFCRAHFSVAMFFGISTIAIGNFIILLRLWVLWERDRRLIFWTLLFFIVTVFATFGFTVRALVVLLPTSGFNKIVGLCVTGTNPVAWGPVWVPSVFFEVMVFVLTCWNAFDRPRTADSALTNALYRDGFAYFVVLFSLRIVNFTLAVAAPPTLTYLCVFFVWCTTTLTLMRFLLNLRELSHNSENGDILMMPMASREQTVSYDETTLNGDTDNRSQDFAIYK